MSQPTPIWTRRELMRQFPRLSTNADVDAFLKEFEDAAASVGMPSPVRVTGEGDDQLIHVDPEFAALARKMGLW